MGQCMCSTNTTGLRCDTCVPHTNGGLVVGAGSVLGPSGCELCSPCSSTVLLVLADQQQAIATYTATLQTVTSILGRLRALNSSRSAAAASQGQKQDVLLAALAMLVNGSALLDAQVANSMAAISPNGAFAHTLNKLDACADVLSRTEAALMASLAQLTEAGSAVYADISALALSHMSLYALEASPAAAAQYASSVATAVAAVEARVTAACTLLQQHIPLAQAQQASQQMIEAGLNVQTADNNDTVQQLSLLLQSTIAQTSAAEPGYAAADQLLRQAQATRTATATFRLGVLAQIARLKITGTHLTSQTARNSAAAAAVVASCTALDALVAATGTPTPDPVCLVFLFRVGIHLSSDTAGSAEFHSNGQGCCEKCFAPCHCPDGGCARSCAGCKHIVSL